MIDKLKSILERYNKVREMLNDPEVAGDLKQYRELSRESKRLSQIDRKSVV